jgi:hypothetical protein
MSDPTPTNICTHCYSVDVPPARWAKGWRTCLPCGDKLAKSKVRTVVPMPKSNYILVTDMELLKGLNSSHRGNR